MDFSIRSLQPELLDRQDIPAADIALNLKELELINRRLGGHAITLQGFRALASGLKKITVAEIGCGGGDNLLAIQKKTDFNRVNLHCIGIDLNPDCINAARQAQWKKIPEFICLRLPAGKFQHAAGYPFCLLILPSFQGGRTGQHVPLDANPFPVRVFHQ